MIGDGGPNPGGNAAFERTTPHRASRCAAARSARDGASPSPSSSSLPLAEWRRAAPRSRGAPPPRCSWRGAGARGVTRRGGETGHWRGKVPVARCSCGQRRDEQGWRSAGAAGLTRGEPAPPSPGMRLRAGEASGDSPSSDKALCAACACTGVLETSAPSLHASIHAATVPDSAHAYEGGRGGATRGRQDALRDKETSSLWAQGHPGCASSYIKILPRTSKSDCAGRHACSWVAEPIMEVTHTLARTIAAATSWREGLRAGDPTYGPRFTIIGSRLRSTMTPAAARGCSASLPSHDCRP